MRFLTLSTLGSCALLAACASVQERDPELVGGWGVVGVLDEENLDGFGIEYRHRPVVWNLVPMIGFSNAPIEDVSYTYAGLNYPLDLNSRWRIAPSLAAGYFDGGGGLDLGGELEFRSAFEVNYLLNKEWRLGAAFTHISNSNLYTFNPGTEAIMLSVHYLF